MRDLAELWAWRNRTHASDYVYHLIDCRHNDAMAAINGQDITQQIVRALAQPYEYRSAGSRELDIINRVAWARTRARIEAMAW